MPHCIPWEKPEDIERAIKEEAKHIGWRNIDLADKCRATCNSNKEDIDKMLVK